MPEPIRLLEFTIWHQDTLVCNDCGITLRFSNMGRAELLQRDGMTLLRPICDRCVRTVKYRYARYE